MDNRESSVSPRQLNKMNFTNLTEETYSDLKRKTKDRMNIDKSN
jgi:hypothetical protein